jgi:hypothetical protein
MRLYGIGVAAWALGTTACSGDEGRSSMTTPTLNTAPMDPDAASPSLPSGGMGGNAGSGEAGVGGADVPSAGVGGGGAAGASSSGGSDATGGTTIGADAGASDSGAPANASGGATQPGVGEACDIANARVVLPEGGFCTLSEEEQLMLGLMGDFDVASCSGGRVTLGFISAGRITLNDVEISCEQA